jgi:hypothetical protein
VTHIPDEGTDPDVDEMLKLCADIRNKKGRDYTLGSRDPLHNFDAAAAFLSLTPEQVLSVYLYKHMAAVFSYVKGKTESEPIAQRIADVINYMLLLHKMVRRGQKEPKPESPGVTGVQCAGHCGDSPGVCGNAAGAGMDHAPSTEPVSDACLPLVNSCGNALKWVPGRPNGTNET